MGLVRLRGGAVVCAALVAAMLCMAYGPVFARAADEVPGEPLVLANVTTVVVQYDTQGGSSVGDTELAVSSDGYPLVASGVLSSTVPTKAGYVFKYWTRYAADIPYPAPYYPGELYAYTGYFATITLYAQWEPGYTHTLRYDANGGEGSFEATVVTTADDTASAVAVDTAARPTRSGYSFAGWSTSADAETAQYAVGVAASVEVAAGAEVTLYAVWAPVVVDEEDPKDPVTPTVPLTPLVPATPTVPIVPDDSENSGELPPASGKPSGPAEPEVPGGSGAPEDPDAPELPDLSENPSESGEPEDPDAPEDPGDSEGPADPEDPGDLGESAAPLEPDVPDGSAPSDSETPAGGPSAGSAGAPAATAAPQLATTGDPSRGLGVSMVFGSLAAGLFAAAAVCLRRLNCGAARPRRGRS